MIYSAEADIVSFIKNLTRSLQPYAQANDMHLQFASTIKKQKIEYQPFLLSQSLTQLLCSIINLLPPESKVEVRMLVCTEYQHILIEIENSGINLIRINGLCAQNKYVFAAFPLTNGTLHRLVIPFYLQNNDSSYSIKKPTVNYTIPHFYAELQKRLRSHFNQAEKRLAMLAESKPQEALFLQRVNALIKANLENEHFDTEALSKAMCMSRTQLFRRLKSLVGQAPANYIKTMRLQRAKELLETTDLTVSEAAFKTGFQTISHFTKVFQKQYGLLPSLFRRNRKCATNE